MRKGIKWLSVIALVAIGWALADAWRGFGQRAEGARLARMKRSAQWRDGRFHNPQPLVNDWWGSLTGAFDISAHASPHPPLLGASVDARVLRTAPASGLRITWLGHASALLELDGIRVLTDPMWSERPSPVTWIGPQRYFAPPIALKDLPRLHAVVISHDHYDHLDHRTLIAMKDWPTKFIVPLGVGAHLAYWGIAESKIIELDWWQRTKIESVDVVCTPARHASGRTPFDRDATLWAGYALVGPRHRVFFSGDTGLFPAMREIGQRLGPFDMTMIEVGQYHQAWPDWHIGPERAVEAHRMLRGRVLLPIHWALLTLAYHGWSEPVERVLAAATKHDVRVMAPRPGQMVEPTDTRALSPWWPSLPWHTAQQDPLGSLPVVE